MNVFIRQLAREEIPREPDCSSSKLAVEDNVGESIHIHLRNCRLEFSIEDYLEFARCVEMAQRRLDDGDY